MILLLLFYFLFNFENKASVSKKIFKQFSQLQKPSLYNAITQQTLLPISLPNQSFEDKLTIKNQHTKNFLNNYVPGGSYSYNSLLGNKKHKILSPKISSPFTVGIKHIADLKYPLGNILINPEYKNILIENNTSRSYTMFTSLLKTIKEQSQGISFKNPNSSIKQARKIALTLLNIEKKILESRISEKQKQELLILVMRRKAHLGLQYLTKGEYKKSYKTKIAKKVTLYIGLCIFTCIIKNIADKIKEQKEITPTKESRILTILNNYEYKNKISREEILLFKKNDSNIRKKILSYYYKKTGHSENEIDSVGISNSITNYNREDITRLLFHELTHYLNDLHIGAFIPFFNINFLYIDINFHNKYLSDGKAIINSKKSHFQKTFNWDIAISICSIGSLINEITAFNHNASLLHYSKKIFYGNDLLMFYLHSLLLAKQFNKDHKKIIEIILHDYIDYSLDHDVHNFFVTLKNYSSNLIDESGLKKYLDNPPKELITKHSFSKIKEYEHIGMHVLAQNNDTIKYIFFKFNYQNFFNDVFLTFDKTYPGKSEIVKSKWNKMVEDIERKINELPTNELPTVEKIY